MARISLSDRRSSLPHDRLLHLVQHVGEGGFESQRLLDLVRRHIGVFAIFEEARALMVPDELDERRRIRLPILWEALEVLEDGLETESRKERHRVFGVFVEI